MSKYIQPISHYPPPWDVHWTGGLDRWTGQDSGTSLVSEGGMSNGCPLDVHWTGRTIASGQRILMANLDMSGVVRGQVLECM